MIEMKTKRKHQGFTLLEIMLVVSIIVIILGVAISKLGNTTAIAKTMRVQADLQAIKTQLQLYESMNGFYPTTEQGLQALVTQPSNDPRPARWYQLFRELPTDPWGNGYIYKNPGLKNPSGYDLFSAGPDRQSDTADDDWGGGYPPCGRLWTSNFSRALPGKLPSSRRLMVGKVRPMSLAGFAESSHENEFDRRLWEATVVVPPVRQKVVSIRLG